MSSSLRLLVVAAALLLAAQPALAQGRAGGPLAQLLRDAARLESEGDLEGAEVALMSLLEADPTSTGGLSRSRGCCGRRAS